MKVDLSAQAVTRRLRQVSELVRVCHALAGPRRRKPQVLNEAREEVNVDSINNAATGGG